MSISSKKVSSFWNLLKIAPADGDYVNNDLIICLNDILLQKQNLMAYGISGSEISTSLVPSNISFDTTNPTIFNVSVNTYKYNLDTQSIDVGTDTLSGTFSSIFILLTKSFNILCDAIMSNHSSLLVITNTQSINSIINNYEKQFINNYLAFTDVTTSINKYASFS